MSHAAVVGVRVGQRLADTAVPIECPYTESLRFRLGYNFFLAPYFRLMARVPKLGLLLLCQSRREKDVLYYAAKSTALLALYSYPGFFGTLRKTKNPWASFWSFVHENCRNARDVRFRTRIAADLLIESINGGDWEILDLAAGSALAPWLAVKETGTKGRMVLADIDMHSVKNQWLAASQVGLLDRRMIAPALVLEQDGMMARAQKHVPEIIQYLKRHIGVTLSPADLLCPETVKPGQLAERIQVGFQMHPVIGDAMKMAAFLSPGQVFRKVSILGYLDYLTSPQIVDILRQVSGLMGDGGQLITANIDFSPEYPYVAAVPWSVAFKKGLVLLEKTEQELTQAIRQAGFRPQRVVRTPGGVYNIVMATKP